MFLHNLSFCPAGGGRRGLVGGRGLRPPYDVTSCLAAWYHVPSQGGLCLWYHAPSRVGL